MNMLHAAMIKEVLRMISPFLEVDLEKIRRNTEQVVSLCRSHNIEVLGVTKGFSAMPPIVSAIAQGGVAGLADSRVENFVELRENGFRQPFTLLRIPRLSNVENVVLYSDTSVNSEITVIQALSEAAIKLNKVHKIILMVDVGDLREGFLQEQVLDVVHEFAGLKGIELQGLGTNMGCYGGILPSTENLSLLVEMGRAVQDTLGLEIPVFSGGGTSSLYLIEKGVMPKGINQLRVGEGILLGTDTTNQRKIPYLFDDAFTLWAEVIEVKEKPSVPIGSIGRDAFGNIPVFVDQGIRKRAILAIGKQDVYMEGIFPLPEGLRVLGGSSDHLIVDVTEGNREFAVGDQIPFRLTYSGLLSACSSKYVTKYFKGGEYEGHSSE